MAWFRDEDAHDPDLPVKPGEDASIEEWKAYDEAFDAWIVERDARWERYGAKRFKRYQERKHLWLLGCSVAIGIYLWWTGDDKTFRWGLVAVFFGWSVMSYLIDIQNSLERIERAMKRKFKEETR